MGVAAARQVADAQQVTRQLVGQVRLVLPAFIRLAFEGFDQLLAAIIVQRGDLLLQHGVASALIHVQQGGQQVLRRHRFVVSRVALIDRVAQRSLLLYYVRHAPAITAGAAYSTMFQADW